MKALTRGHSLLDSLPKDKAKTDDLLDWLTRLAEATRRYMADHLTLFDKTPSDCILDRSDNRDTETARDERELGRELTEEVVDIDRHELVDAATCHLLASQLTVDEGQLGTDDAENSMDGYLRDSAGSRAYPLDSVAED